MSTGDRGNTMLKPTVLTTNLAIQWLKNLPQVTVSRCEDIENGLWVVNGIGWTRDNPVAKVPRNLC